MLYQAPSPQRKKEAPPKENKLRLFLKRSSEPLLNLQNAAQQVRHAISFTSQGMFFALQSTKICDLLTPTLSTDNWKFLYSSILCYKCNCHSKTCFYFVIRISIKMYVILNELPDLWVLKW